MFGKLPGEEQATLQDFKLAHDEEGVFHGSPWALQAQNDLLAMAHVENGPALLHKLGDAPLRVLEDEFRVEFGKLNFRSLRK
eukprot:2372354-Pyramimonas_sp.AAC.1